MVHRSGPVGGQGRAGQARTRPEASPRSIRQAQRRDGRVRYSAHRAGGASSSRRASAGRGCGPMVSSSTRGPSTSTRRGSPSEPRPRRGREPRPAPSPGRCPPGWSSSPRRSSAPPDETRSGCAPSACLGAATGGFDSAARRTVRGPDVAFVSRERILEQGYGHGFWHLAPDLVEIVSPSIPAPRKRGYP